ncbi:hypothetical protein PYW07_015170 [Mythimna separata]|uniref:Uncharacterized protein n=1 Tax=Mythimna separata TaxID=271217 RepID=A0AAD8DYP5_MYTSE|nr:hypothetical protein PYW07_015170 [Mythimna separata]
MKSKVILFCILLFSSKIVDSNPHSEGLHRHRVNQPSIWQGNQNAQDARYLDTDFTQTQKLNTLSNSAIQQESIQDYNLNQGRHNSNGYRYNKSPASLSSGKGLLENYSLQTEERRLESYPPRVESYPSDIGFDNQQFRKENWGRQNLYTNSVPSTVLITDNERPLVNTVQEPYRAPVQYIQPKYVPSENRRLLQPDRSYQIREQLQYPLANNAGDSEYVANPGPRFRSRGPVSYDNYSEGQAEASEIKTKLTNGPRYLHNLPPQSGNVYNEIPLVVATDTLTDQSENIKYLENYKSSSDLSNTASSRGSAVVENYGIDSRFNNVPESHGSYSKGQTAGSEIKRILSGDQRHIQSFAPQSEIIYNESPAVIATDTLEDQFKNIHSVENYRSRSDLSQTVQTKNYDDDSRVISADSYNLHSRPSNGPVSYKSYDDVQVAESKVNPRPIEAQRHEQNFAHQPKMIYNDIPAVIATDVLADESSNIKYEKRENSKSRSELSNTATNYDADSSVISAVEGSRPSNNPVPHVKHHNIQPALSDVRHRHIGGRQYLQKVALEPIIVYNDVPAVIATDILPDQSNNIRYEKREDQKSSSDLSNIAPVTYQDGTSQVISTVDNTDSNSKPSNPVPENIENEAPIVVSKILSDKPLARRYAHNYRPETESSNTGQDNSFNGAPKVVSETVEEKSAAYEVNYEQNEPAPINTYSKTSPTSTDTVQTKHQINKIEENDVPSYEFSSPIPDSNNPDIDHKMKELNLNKFNIQKLMDGSPKPYLVIHPNGTVEHLDTIDLDSQQNPFLRLVNIKHINVDDTEGEETQSPELVPNDIAKTIAPQNETPLPADTQSAYYRKSTPLNEYLDNYAYESDSTVLPVDQGDSNLPNYSDKLTPVVNQPADDDNPKLQRVNQQGDDDKIKPLRPYIRHTTHHHKSKLTDAIQLAFDNKSKPSIPDENQLAVEQLKPKPNDSYLSSPDENQPSDINAANWPWTENQPGNDKNSKPVSHPHKRRSHIHHHKSKLLNINQSTEDADSSLSPNEKQPLDDNNYKTLPLNENQPIVEIDSQTLHLHKNKPVHHHHTSKHSHSNQPQDANIVSSSYSSENKPADDNDSNTYPDSNNSKLSNESQVGNNNKLKPILTHYRQPAHHNEPKLTHENKPEDNKKIKPSSFDKNISTNDDNFPKNKSDEDDKSKPLSPGNNQIVDDDTSENKPEGDKIFNKHKGKPAHHNKPKLSHEDQSENVKNVPNDKSDDIEPIDDDTFLESQPQNKTEIKPITPHYRKPALHSEPTYGGQSENSNTSSQNKPRDDVNSNPSLPDDNDVLDDDVFPESQTINNNKSKTINPYENQSENYGNSPEDKSRDNNNSKSSFLIENNPLDDDIFENKPEDNTSNAEDDEETNESIDDDTSLESPPRNNDKNKPKYPQFSQEDQSENDDTYPQDEPEDDVNSNPSPLDENQSEEDDTYLENYPEDDINSISLPAGENEYGHNKKKTTASKTDDQPVSTTSSPAVPNDIKSSKPRVIKKHKHRHVSRKSTTKSLIVTTPSPNETSEDQIITLSPIEQSTDNVSDVPLVTTTTAKPPTKTSGGKSDKIKETKNKKKNSVNLSSKDFTSITDRVRKSSTKASTNSSTKLTNNKSDSKTTKGTGSNENTQTNDNAVESQVNNVKNAQTVQSAVYDASELLDTNTDALAKSDDNSPVTTSPSVQSVVNTGDISGVNTLEYEQPQTDVIITVSSSTDNDSEDDIITINVEVFETTGLSSNKKSLLVNIDTENESDDNFETQQGSDRVKDHNDKNDDGKGKNLEIDLPNIEGEPTMWIRTTNQDFIEKLMNKNDTDFDMVYFFNIVNKPIIEREKVTTIHCNGTVVIETKEITYANKEDQTPTIVKTTETMTIEDYKRYCLDSSSD